MWLYIFVHINIILNNNKKKEISIQICKKGNALIANVQHFPGQVFKGVHSNTGHVLRFSNLLSSGESF